MQDSYVNRGTQRLFSVKYLFVEANIAENLLLLEDGLKFLDRCSIHVQFSKLVKEFFYHFLKFDFFYILSPRLHYFS